MKIHIVLGALALIIISNSPPASAATADLEMCARLQDIMRISTDSIIKGQYQARLDIALEAHTRLDCPVEGLLSVLSIQNRDKRVPKATTSTFQQRDSNRTQ